MREDIKSFTPNTNEEYPFFIDMTGVSYCDGTYRIERRKSKIYVFEYIIEGEGTVNINGTAFTAEKGDVYILPYGNTHLYYSSSKKPWTKIWFNIHGPLIDNLMQVYHLNNTYHIKNFDLYEMFYKMLNLAKTQNITQNELFSRASLLFHEIIIKISQRVHKSSTYCTPEAAILKNLLDKSIEGSISIKELGDSIFRSPSQTIRIFRKEFGTTPHDYLLNKKIETAKLLLQNTNISIKEIAYKLCFADEHYFSNHFKTKVGISPLKFRISGGLSSNIQ